MTKDEIMHLVNRSLFATIGYSDEVGRQNVRRVFCVWHKGLGRHLISTNTSSAHVQSLLKNGNACLILNVNTENSFGMKAMKNTIRKVSRMTITASWNS